MPKPINPRTFQTWPDHVAAAGGNTRTACQALAVELASAATSRVDHPLTKTRIHWTSAWSNKGGITDTIRAMFADVSVRPEDIAATLNDYIVRCRIVESDNIVDYDSVVATIRTRTPDAVNSTVEARLEFYDFDVTPFLNSVDKKWGRSSKYFATGYSFTL
jgi:hypothetical protein